MWVTDQPFQDGVIDFVQLMWSWEGPTKKGKFKLHLARRIAAPHSLLSLGGGRCSSATTRRKPIRDANVTFGKVGSEGTLDIQVLVSEAPGRKSLELAFEGEGG